MSGIFCKQNTTVYADALICEAEGLRRLFDGLKEAGVGSVRVPEVFRVDESTLEMTAITPARSGNGALETLGEGLAALHRLPQSMYGWHRDNYIGLSPQPNCWAEYWGEFFVQERLRYQVSRIRASGVRNRFEGILDQCDDTLIGWLNEHCDQPSLLHGDLWSGNVLFSQEGPWLIDPAIYCGDREADLAMTEMFGGFGSAFYRAYDRAFPRTPVYEQKREIYNLYHYLNHYNLFGSSYQWGCERGFVAMKELCMRTA